MTVLTSSSAARARCRQARGTAVVFVALCTWCHGAEAPREPVAQAAPGRRAVFDPAVVPAGGCQGCKATSCRTCRNRQSGHHAGCRDGKCHAHCPVRPQEFGFYGTQWRRWPAAGVAPVSYDDAVTPVTPPKSQVPRSDEESRRDPSEPATPEPQPEPAARSEGPRTGAANEAPAAGAPAPRGDEDPSRSPRPPAAINPRLLPQSLRLQDPTAVRPMRMADALPTGVASRRAASSTGTVPPPQAVSAPEPVERDGVVTTAAEAEDDHDESSLGPARRRFVARRLPAGGQSGAAAE